MSHVDDGILHAYLDGALDALSDAGELPDGTSAADVISHLGTCADCRARLETERAVREGAGLVMGSLPQLPASSMPEFPALATSTPRRKRWIPLGWAASVVLAVGAGWVGSEVWRTGGGSLGLERSDPQSSTESAASGITSPEAGASADAMTPMRAGEFLEPAASEAAESSDAATTSDPLKLSEAAESSDAMKSTEVSQSAQPQSGSARIADNNASSAQDPTAGAAAAAPPAAALLQPPGRVDPMAPGATAEAPPPPASETRRIDSLAFTLRAPMPAQGSPDSISAIMRITNDAEERVIASADPVAGRSRVPLGNALVSVDEQTGNRLLAPVPGSVPDAQSVLAGRMHEMIAFDSIIAREQSGRIHFANVSLTDVKYLANQIFVIADASAPSVEAAQEIGQTVVRVRQTMASGEQVELVTWRRQAVELNALVVTGVPSDARSRAQAGARSGAPERGVRGEAAEARSQQDVASAVVVQVMRPRIRTLDDNRRELVLGTADASVWIAVRAHVSEDELRTIANRVTIR